MSNYFHTNLQSIVKNLLVNVKNDDKLSDVERTKKIRDLENKIKKLEDLKAELNQSCSKNLYDEESKGILKITGLIFLLNLNDLDI